MTALLWIMLGGALGTGGRYVLATSIQTSSGAVFPYGTLAVNLLGCLLIGALAVILSDNSNNEFPLKLALVVGCLGGFTTFSSFGLETLSLIQSGRISLAIVYVMVSNVCGLGLAWCGYRIGGFFNA